MKSSSQNKSISSNAKPKKNLKEREKRKSQNATAEVNNHNNSVEKGSPTKDSNSNRLYAGIDTESLGIYAEQSAVEHLSEEVSNTLTEDINYKLRYIINDALIKARLSGRNAINSSDIEQCFENLNIEKVYGAPSHPNWLPFGNQSLYHLDDKVINLVEIAEGETVHVQYAETIISRKWLPEQKDVSKSLRTYFTTMCQMVVSHDMDVRRMALTNIGENSRIGPITEWFYNFSYILLSKDITYDSLTLRALDLIETLENSPLCRINVPEKQLRFLVRLILQRLLKSATTCEVLKPMCRVLAILCWRMPLREFVLLKIAQKMAEIYQNYALPIVSVANSFGVDAVKALILPNLGLFLKKAQQIKPPEFRFSLLESLYMLHKENSVDVNIYEGFYEVYGDILIMFHSTFAETAEGRGRRENNFVNIKRQLLRTRRKIKAKSKKSPVNIEEVFEMPASNSPLGRKLSSFEWDKANSSQINTVTIGRTNLLLPVLVGSFAKAHLKCQNHTMLSYNL